MDTGKLFGLDIYTRGAGQLLFDLKKKTGKTHIISGNAEVLKQPLSDKDVYNLFMREENIIIPDGISVYYPLKRKDRNCQKLPGIELMQALLEDFQVSGKTAYFLGAKPGIVEQMLERFALKYPDLKIAGFHHGYFDKNNCADIIANIRQSQAFALFVALGPPAQENFIFKYINELPCSVYMGVGGSFDVLSGTVKRSPRWMRNLGLEWLYRIIADPSKIGRMRNNISFTIKALLYG
jgi:N-acetylglucosaminyldiphosphoundecaprenol N-acetyl-beta-D-mannosaminyltransferase